MVVTVRKSKWPPRHVSASQLTAYLVCRLKKKLDSERWTKPSGPMKVGSAGHRVLEAWLRTPVNLRTEVRIKALVEGQYKGLDGLQQANMRRSIAGYWKEFGPDPTVVPTEVESDQQVLLYDDVWLVGTFDWLTINGSVIIGEHKFSMKEPDVKDKVWWTHQPLVYYYMAEKLWPDLTQEKSVHTLLWPGGADRVDRPIHLPEEWREFIPYLAKEMLETSPPIPTYGWHCNRCDHKDVCYRKLKAGIEETAPTLPAWLQPGA